MRACSSLVSFLQKWYVRAAAAARHMIVAWSLRGAECCFEPWIAVKILEARSAKVQGLCYALVCGGVLLRAPMSDERYTS